ncbi:MAG: cyclase family protein [Alphaproteobacteria bacterium]|nr:cyclase family protein [Alphaproteobacteria bacterium]
MTSSFVDLSQTVHDGMPGIRRRNADGSVDEETVRLRITRTRAESSAGFESTEIAFPTAIATYIDAPYCRYAEMRDISGLELGDVILPGIAVDCRGMGDRTIASASVLPKANLAGHAVLFHFGWDRHWGTERYGAHPAIGPDIVDRLIAEGAKLMAVDSGSADAPGTPDAPVHSRLLARDILIVENLVDLGRLIGRRFRFFAVPIKARGATSMTVRAFAELL